MESPTLLDAVGRPRSPATLPGHFSGRPPRNKGRHYQADPPRVEEIVLVMRAAGPGASGDRMRALVVMLWRAGLRLGEALALVESDLDPTRGSVLVRHGKGDKRRESGMDDWAWEQVAPWLAARQAFPVGPLFCVITGPTAGRPWSQSAVAGDRSRVTARSGRERCARFASSSRSPCLIRSRRPCAAVAL